MKYLTLALIGMATSPAEIPPLDFDLLRCSIFADPRPEDCEPLTPPAEE